MQAPNTKHKKEEKKIPNLRFPGFEGEWESKVFGDLTQDASYGMNSAAIEFDGINKYLRITDIDEKSRKFVPKPLTSPNGELEDKYRLKMRDIVFARTGASVGKCYLYNDFDGRLYYAGFLIKFSIKKNAEPYFIYSYTFVNNYMKWVKVMSMRSGQPGINSEEYKSLKFHIPSLTEQKKIASFLSAVDQKIQHLTRKKEVLELYKKGVMQRIFAAGKNPKISPIRFKDENGNDFPDWKERGLNELLYESKKRNYDFYFGKKDVLSVSGDYGIVNQIEFQGRSFAGESVANYHIVEAGDIVYTKSPLKANPFGIIKVNKGKPGIVSTLYAVYKCKETASGVYLDYYFQLDDNVNRYLRPLVHKGAKNDMKINNSRVLIDTIWTPGKDEQNRIAIFLEIIDKKIEKATYQLTQTQTFKKGLLQQMFV